MRTLSRSIRHAGRIGALAMVALFLVGPLLHAAAQPARLTHFTVDEWLYARFQYAGPKLLVGIDVPRHFKTEYPCQVHGAMDQTKAPKELPKGDKLVFTCFHVAFGGPLPHGAALPAAAKNDPFGYFELGVLYDATGHLVEAQPMHFAASWSQCWRDAKATRAADEGSNTLPRTDSLLIYCIGLPGENQPVPPPTGHAV